MRNRYDKAVSILNYVFFADKFSLVGNAGRMAEISGRHGFCHLKAESHRYNEEQERAPKVGKRS